MKVEVKQKLEDNYRIGVDASEDLIKADREMNFAQISELSSEEKEDTVDEAPSIVDDEVDKQEEVISMQANCKFADFFNGWISFMQSSSSESESSGESATEDGTTSKSISKKWNRADNVKVCVQCWQNGSKLKAPKFDFY